MRPFTKLITAFVGLTGCSHAPGADSQFGTELVLPIVTTGILDDTLHYSSTITVMSLSGTTVASSGVLYSDTRSLLNALCFGFKLGIPETPIAIPTSVVPILQDGQAVSRVTSNPQISVAGGWARIEATKDIAASVELALVEGAPSGCLQDSITSRRSEQIRASSRRLQCPRIN